MGLFPALFDTHKERFQTTADTPRCPFSRECCFESFADLRAKKANCIIVKDISRLGRHYIMTSEYVEKVFPEMGVRLICINDDYDSEDTHSDRDGLLMPFKAFLNFSAFVSPRS